MRVIEEPGDAGVSEGFATAAKLKISNPGQLEIAHCQLQHFQG